MFFDSELEDCILELKSSTSTDAIWDKIIQIIAEDDEDDEDGDEYLYSLLANSKNEQHLSSPTRRKKRTEYGRSKKQHFKLDRSPWYKYIKCDIVDDIYDESSSKAKNFRTDFRVPYTMYQEIVHEIGSSTNEAWSCLQTKTNSVSESVADPIPHDLLILCCLRLLGRNNYYRELSEMSGVSVWKLHEYFKNFVTIYGNYKFQQVVRPPAADDIEEVQQCMYAYGIAGLPGCIGSVDCVHIDWEAPWRLKNLTECGRYGGSRKTMVCQMACNNKRKILSATSAFYGTWNDATITKYDPFVQSVIRGEYKDVDYHVYDINGHTFKQKGCWLLVDGGYSRVAPHLQYPYPDHSGNECGWMLRTRMESIRKDIECTFGILKKRFLILKRSIRCQDPSMVSPIINTCCALHNMLIDHDEWCLVEGNTTNTAGLQYDDGDDDRLYGDDPRDNRGIDGGLRSCSVQFGNEDESDCIRVQGLTLADLRKILENNITIMKDKKELVWPKYRKKKKRNQL